jgi:hypothetical protein
MGAVALLLRLHEGRRLPHCAAHCCRCGHPNNSLGLALRPSLCVANPSHGVHSPSQRLRTSVLLGRGRRRFAAVSCTATVPWVAHGFCAGRRVVRGDMGLRCARSDSTTSLPRLPSRRLEQRLATPPRASLVWGRPRRRPFPSISHTPASWFGPSHGIFMTTSNIPCCAHMILRCTIAYDTPPTTPSPNHVHRQHPRFS